MPSGGRAGTDMSQRWQLRIDRVLVHGATGPMPPAGELRALVEAAIGQALADARLPAGRAVQAAVHMQVPALGQASAVAQAVAQGVKQAVGGGAGHG